ncbi:Protein-tyrosine phosphatase, receptor/non-receptor type domain and Protein-tyrosine/Dual specificity phosphatase domain and Protein-tyrosine phosphatase, catalytic domain-containing protein [Strongyloides ratti]|uniref:Protein-tyrosine phosphatase, receptor/non-receptor type domain and Protein-tyrosine/Dual specificity phosphatase domain and Protein-tyrosine phosphatase, catalytic domain-containing protein n=1 Tax=Strongyloides ratti TaxID=34506 RepID=A0A090MYB9_STRRB|nr:Protein-tyrosine phosphatase, receptor/non-receptor type domain and Protein-tyrosine/Dual specificity phosphatase domain and Protein-tyrosine phosphatase, catalytic domain-containing protein [Strongyloides ratti]CEF66914.1 Protein-tyrosine phosphatase, receptor/non-receptor type domain and Protein-tyrosine/Dual specificity phosphatase domain and Protein-tyrosine phosphatase, catalytic domain-containing protein [Strongyloides ratti]
MDNNKESEKKEDVTQRDSCRIQVKPSNKNSQSDTKKLSTSKTTLRRKVTRRQKGGSKIVHNGTNRKRSGVSTPAPPHEKSLVLKLLQIVKAQNPSLNQKDSGPSQSSLLGNILDDCIKKGIEGLTIEYFSISRSKVEPAEYVNFLLPENRPKNRYRDILCLENKRVKLKDIGNDYIHANYVKTPRSEKSFICTQGPTTKSCLDFWKMCIQEDVEYIVMLCQFEENNIKKCAKYYPYDNGCTLSFGSVIINNEKINESSDINLRDINLKIQHEGGTKKIRHLQYLGWPDKGVPDLSDTLLNMLDIVKKSNKPVVVHCSAGIGRTGTFVLIQNIMERIHNPEIGGNDTSINILKEMRSQRYGVVQTDFQYIFAHRLVLASYIKTKKIDVEENKDLNRWLTFYKKIYEKYTTTCKTTKTGTVEEDT